MKTTLEYKLGWIAKLLFILISFFALQISIVSASVNPFSLGLNPNNPTSECNTSDENEGSSWIEVGLTRVLSKSKAGSECKRVLWNVCNAARGSTQFTKSSLKLGRQVHRTYKANLHNPAKGLYKEFTGVKGVRPDFVDFNKRVIYELKPNNPAQIKAGWRQLGRYKSAFEQQYGGQWKTVLDLY